MYSSSHNIAYKTRSQGCSGWRFDVSAICQSYKCPSTPKYHPKALSRTNTAYTYAPNIKRWTHILIMHRLLLVQFLSFSLVSLRQSSLRLYNLRFHFTFVWGFVMLWTWLWEYLVPSCTCTLLQKFGKRRSNFAIEMQNICMDQRFYHVAMKTIMLVWLSSIDKKMKRFYYKTTTAMCESG